MDTATGTERAWQDGDMVTFVDDKGVTHVAIRRDYKWKDGQWQVAIHGFWRVTDEFITERGTRLEPVGPLVCTEPHSDSAFEDIPHTVDACAKEPESMSPAEWLSTAPQHLSGEE